MQYPDVNGKRYSFSSVEAKFNDQRYIGFKAVAYKSSLKPGIVRGTDPNKLGRTRGQGDHTGSFEMFKEEWETLKASLGDGFMEVPFNIVVAYAEDGSPVATDALYGCRITDVDDTHSEGPDALTVKCELDIMDVDYNGVRAFKPIDTRGLI